MDFVWLFCRIMAMFIVKKGITEGVRLNKKIIRFIEGLYIRGSHIYNHALSTTKRPHYLKMFKFVVIHLFDPHLLCVPSLHVAIVVGVWAKVREILSETSFSEEEKSMLLLKSKYGNFIDEYACDFYSERGSLPMFHIVENIIKEELKCNNKIQFLNYLMPMFKGGIPLTLEQIAEKCNLTRERVRQICTKGID